MKSKLLLLAIVVCAAALMPQSAPLAQTGSNQIGIYTTPDANPDNVNYNGAPGSFTAYCVITNPRNYHYGDPNSTEERTITRIGGFEFKLVVPAGVFILAQTLPPLTANFHPDPQNFFCGTNLPVVDGAAVCVTLSIGAFSGAPAQLFVAPVNTVPTFPGHMAITDYDDDFRENIAYPASGSFDAPVFGLWSTVVPTEDASWGELKTLFR